MKISLNWLTDYVDVSIPADALGELFTRIGLNCDGIAEVGDDIVFDLDVTSNRPDCLGHLGVSRELASASGATFRPPTVGDLRLSGVAQELTSVEVAEPALCPRYIARVIRGVKVGPSPAWMVERLAAVGLRSVNNVVDVTNYVMLEYSQPLHSFDYDKLDGRRIVVRRARPGEQIVSIDGTRCRLDESMLVIADAQRPVAVAGVMGGLDSEVSEATTNILLEAAQFDPLSIRHTSRKLMLMSDSNYRFERGVDAVGVETAGLRACQLILELAGGTLARGMVDVWANPHRPTIVALRPERTDKVIGLHIPPARQAELLGRLGLSPKMDAGKIVCEIPSHRRDLQREIDLIEEVARLHGYEHVPVAGEVKHPVRPQGLKERTRRAMSGILMSAGYDEALTFTFIDADEAVLFGENQPLSTDPRVRRTNNTLRPTLLPSLLRACKTNQDDGCSEVSLFELAAVFPPAGQGGLPQEFVELGMVTAGELRELRGAVETLIERIAPDAPLTIEPSDVPGLAAGTAARITLDGRAVGSLGLISQAVRDRYGLERTYAVGRLSFEALLEHAGKVRTYRPVPRFPAVQRDLSLIVDDAVTWRQIEEVFASLSQPMRQSVDYVTTYRGKPIAAGRKSVTLTLTYRSDEGTLRSEQVDEQVAAVLAAMKQALAAELRV